MFLILHGLFLLVMLFKVSLILPPCPVGNRVRQIPLQLRDGHHVNPRGWMVTHYFRTVLDGMTINIPCFDQGLKYRNGWPSIPSISYINIYISIYQWPSAQVSYTINIPCFDHGAYHVFTLSPGQWDLGRFLQESTDAVSALLCFSGTTVDRPRKCQWIITRCFLPSSNMFKLMESPQFL